MLEKWRYPPALRRLLARPGWCIQRIWTTARPRHGADQLVDMVLVGLDGPAVAAGLRDSAAAARPMLGLGLVMACLGKRADPMRWLRAPTPRAEGSSAKSSHDGMGADQEETQGVFCSRAVAINKEDNAVDRPNPRSDHGRECCRGSWALPGRSKHEAQP